MIGLYGNAGEQFIVLWKEVSHIQSESHQRAHHN